METETKTEGFIYVPRIQPEEEKIWEEALELFKKEGILEKVEKFPEDLKIRFIRGSEFLTKRSKMLARIVRTVKECLEFREEFDVDNIFSKKT